VNIAEQGRLGQVQQVIVALDFAIIVGKPIAPEGGFIQLEVLDHGTHTAIEHDNAFLQSLVKLLQTGFAIGHKVLPGFSLIDRRRIIAKMHYVVLLENLTILLGLSCWRELT
jgi:hypothetical protein